MNSMRHRTITIVVLALPIVQTCCARPEHAGRSIHDDDAGSVFTQRSGRATVQLPSPNASLPVDYPGLHNVVAYGPALLSGSAPEGDAGFSTLQAMGVRMVMSVDGAVPSANIAAARGVRYVHLPIGYDGAVRGRTLELARAVQLALAQAPLAPIYIHCHHGKHRSAAASGAVAVALGRLTPDQAVGRMRVSGTSKEYAGLFRWVVDTRLAGSEELAAAGNEFPAAWKTSGLIKTMVEIDGCLDRLKLIERAGWKTPDDHPDLVPVAEAGRLADLLRDLLDDDQVKAKSPDFRLRIADASKYGEAVEDGCAEGRLSTDDMSGRLQVLMRSCKACHETYRN